MSKLFEASVKANKQLANNHYLLTLHPQKKIIRPEPGQFFMLSAGSSLDPLLKRPFSLFRWFGPDFQILYRVVGKVTGNLRAKTPGTILELIGPLGNGFPALQGNRQPILVGGGIGSAPLFALAEKTKHKKPIFFMGAKSKHEILYKDALQSIGLKPFISTDDGTMGKKGLVTDIVNDFLTRYSSRVAHYGLYACGPRQMLKSLSILAQKFHLEGYFALEENMACGIGACLSCVVNTRYGMRRVCKEGPVFPAEEIIW